MTTTNVSEHPATILARDASTKLRLEGATHIDRLGETTWIAYRPAPGFPGEYGKKAFWRNERGWHLAEPWILSHHEPVGHNPSLLALLIVQQAIAKTR